MNGRILFVVCGVLILGIGLYIYQAGLLSKAINGVTSTSTVNASSSSGSGSGSSWFSIFPSNTSPAQHFAAPGKVFTWEQPVPTSTYSSFGSGGGGGINPYDIPPGFTADQISPYFHQVRLGSISPGNFYSPGQISIYAYPNQGVVSIDVTNWQLRSNNGGEYIPQAVNIYDASGLAPATDIRLTSGDTLNIYSTSAPVNLRLNKCIGFLPNKSQFSPQLPQNCPYLDHSAVQYFSGACQNYIQSLGSCGTPNLSSPYIPQNDYACRDYLNTHFTYRSCLDEHQGDADFLSHEVRVWAGSSPVDPFHDTVRLLDQNGLLVDLTTY